MEPGRLMPLAGKWLMSAPRERIMVSAARSRCSMLKCSGQPPM
eukprot:CAMPEP_0176255978 /NCGR_PEP_ID=MMETSP0121_2-20121125/37312_1 /TAXON_ID=160619 /ORGANISM="Kryptoperidinium foliaceum, Strain CCMP 1326" /LENGTH=42 /DNA_ID= /DNA_START= /DNA_END= /DNA_ORIENTATION=